MALHVHVFKMNKNNLEMIGDWEDGRFWGEFVIPRVEGQTAAETVELFFLERNMVASWMWGKGCCGRSNALHGQFVHAASHGGKAFKEVNDSLAKQFDL